MSKRVIISALMAMVILGGLKAQESDVFKPTFNVSGFTHLWTGYGQYEEDDQYGFVVRYARLKAFGDLTPNVKWTLQFGFDKGVASLYDIYLTYEPASYAKIRFGQFGVPGAKSSIFTSPLWSSTKMIINDRPMITQNWNSNAGLSGYRSGGAMFFGEILDSKLHYYLMVGMPKSGPNYYFSTSVKNPIATKDENGFAGFGRIEYRPTKEIEFGINYHLGKGTTDDTISVKRSSYSAYFLTKQEKLYVMAEFIAGANETSINDNVITDDDLKYNGYFVDLGYRFAGKYMPAIRYSSYTPNDNEVDGNGFKKYDNITIGFNYYPSDNIALMLNFVKRLEETGEGIEKIDNDIAYLQLRYIFPKLSSKK